MTNENRWKHKYAITHAISHYQDDKEFLDPIALFELYEEYNIDQFHVDLAIENGSALFSSYNGNNNIDTFPINYDKMIEEFQIQKEQEKAAIKKKNEPFLQSLKEVEEMDKYRIRKEKVRKRNNQCPNRKELFIIAKTKEDSMRTDKIKFYTEDGGYVLKEKSEVIYFLQCYEKELHLNLIPLVTSDHFSISDSRLKIVLDIIYFYNEIIKAESEIKLEQEKISEYQLKEITFIEEKCYNDALFDYQESLEVFTKVNNEFHEKYGEKYDLDKREFIKEESPIIIELKKIVSETSYYTEEEKKDILFMLDGIMPYKVKKFLKGDFKNKYKPLLYGIRQNAFGKRIDDINDIKKEKDKIIWKIIVPIRRFQAYDREIEKYQNYIKNSQFHIDFDTSLIIKNKVKMQKKIKWLYEKIQVLKNHKELELIMKDNWKEEIC